MDKHSLDRVKQELVILSGKIKELQHGCEHCEMAIPAIFVHSILAVIDKELWDLLNAITPKKEGSKAKGE